MNTFSQSSIDNLKLTKAPISFAVAVIPTEPIYSQVAKASLAINTRCENRNIIDNVNFPCHITLIISGTDDAGINSIANFLKNLKLSLKATASHVYSRQNGLIGIEIQSDSINSLHLQVIKIIEAVQKNKPFIRLHLQSRWSSLSIEKQRDIQSFGSYHVNKDFTPHISVALVDKPNINDMMKITKKNILIPQEIKFKELQLIDVGHDNEKWKILERVSLL